MTAKLDRTLRREIQIGSEAYVIAIDPSGLKLTRKGHRKGVELGWKALVSGDAALAAALNASLRAGSERKAGSLRTTASSQARVPRPRRSR
jgi:hypothetical protein